MLPACPVCDGDLTLTLRALDTSLPGGATFSCPGCHTTLTVQWEAGQRPILTAAWPRHAARMHLPTRREDAEAEILDAVCALDRLDEMGDEDRAIVLGRREPAELAQVAHWLSRAVELLEL